MTSEGGEKRAEDQRTTESIRYEGNGDVEPAGDVLVEGIPKGELFPDLGRSDESEQHGEDGRDSVSFGDVGLDDLSFVGDLDSFGGKP